MQTWFIPAVLSVTFWGLWGFFGKVASGGLPPRSVLFIESLVGLIVAACWMAAYGFKFEATSQKAPLYAMLTGIALGFGQMFFFVALSRGKASVIIIMTALYPLVTIALSFLFLKEGVTWTQGLGIALALAAIPLLSL
jgi:transporter family protein